MELKKNLTANSGIPEILLPGKNVYITFLNFKKKMKINMKKNTKVNFLIKETSMKKRKKKNLSTKNFQTCHFFQKLQQVNLDNLVHCMLWQCHLWIQFFRKMIGFVFMKNMNDELVEKFNRKIFGTKTTDLTAKSGTFRIKNY